MVGIGCGCVAIVEKDVVLWVRFVAGKKYYLLFWKGGAHNNSCVRNFTDNSLSVKPESPEWTTVRDTVTGERAISSDV